MNQQREIQAVYEKHVEICCTKLKTCLIGSRFFWHEIIDIDTKDAKNDVDPNWSNWAKKRRRFK